ncbi:uncharacterized protein LOC139917824 [Centroberyx gerrardi]
MSQEKRYYSASQDQNREVCDLPLPVQCEADQAGLNGVVVFGDLTFIFHPDQRRGDELPLPVQCEAGLNGVVVFGDLTFPFRPTPSADNSTGAVKAAVSTGATLKMGMMNTDEDETFSTSTSNKPSVLNG